MPFLTSTQSWRSVIFSSDDCWEYGLKETRREPRCGCEGVREGVEEGVREGVGRRVVRTEKTRRQLRFRCVDVVGGS